MSFSTVTSWHALGGPKQRVYIYIYLFIYFFLYMESDRDVDRGGGGETIHGAEVKGVKLRRRRGERGQKGWIRRSLTRGSGIVPSTYVEGLLSSWPWPYSSSWLDFPFLDSPGKTATYRELRTLFRTSNIWNKLKSWHPVCETFVQFFEIYVRCSCIQIWHWISQRNCTCQLIT